MNPEIVDLGSFLYGLLLFVVCMCLSTECCNARAVLSISKFLFQKLPPLSEFSLQNYQPCGIHMTRGIIQVKVVISGNIFLKCSVWLLYSNFISDTMVVWKISFEKFHTMQLRSTCFIVLLCLNKNQRITLANKILSTDLLSLFMLTYTVKKLPWWIFVLK